MNARQIFCYSLALAWCFALLGARTLLTLNFGFAFLVFNLFLAAIPLLLALVLHFAFPQPLRDTLLVATWLAFFPNAPYLITDLIHITQRHDSLVWLDMMMILSFAGLGLALALHSLRLVQDRIGHYFPGWIPFVASGIALFLAGFGVYLGRFLRFNSWDILLHPWPLFNAIADRLMDPFDHLRTWTVTLGFGFFLGLIHLVFSLGWRSSEGPRMSWQAKNGEA